MGEPPPGPIPLPAPPAPLTATLHPCNVRAAVWVPGRGQGRDPLWPALHGGALPQALRVPDHQCLVVLKKALHSMAALAVIGTPPLGACGRVPLCSWGQ